MNNFDFKIYSVDRFDHSLSISEAKSVSFLSYIEIGKNGIDPKIREEYENEENRLTDFLVDILTSNCPIINLKLKARKDQALTKKETSKLTEWEASFVLSLLDQLRYKEIKIENTDQLRSIIKLSFKEKIRLLIDFNNSLYSSGFDLCMYFQNIEINHLLSYTNKHGLYILGDWYETLWTNED